MIVGTGGRFQAAASHQLASYIYFGGLFAGTPRTVISILRDSAMMADAYLYIDTYRQVGNIYGIQVLYIRQKTRAAARTHAAPL